MTTVLLPGAGSGGSAWDGLRSLVGPSELHQAPDLDSVPAMAEEVIGRLSPDLDRPVLVGASLGAVIAIEIARRVRVAGMVLMASGWGVTVDPEVLSAAESPNPGLLIDWAEADVVDQRPELVASRLKDFEARDAGVLYRHLRALADHRPEPLDPAPPTVVLWGCEDRSVPLRAHAELTAQLSGILVPLPGVGHCAYLEAPDRVAHWVERVVRRDGEPW